MYDPAKNHAAIAVDSISCSADSITYWMKEQLQTNGTTLANSELFKQPDGSYLFSRTFYLGTDKYGRDLLSRLMAGTLISLAVGSIAVIISLLVGLTLGLLAGYYRGWVDQLIMWFTNVIWAVPTLILVMAITFAFGTGFWKVFLAVGLTMWVEVARIARGQVLSIREKEYIEAARALGFSEMRIIFKHVLPNILSPIIVISAANFASAILIEAGLSFLGLGAQIPTPSWGNMIREHYAYITTDLAYLAIVPGFMIMLLVLAFMMVGNGLRDALDVRE
jgi:peptide/nickel transport system permease protein